MPSQELAFKVCLLDLIYFIESKILVYLMHVNSLIYLFLTQSIQIGQRRSSAVICRPTNKPTCEIALGLKLISTYLHNGHVILPSITLPRKHLAQNV